VDLDKILYEDDGIEDDLDLDRSFNHFKMTGV
jgi:hypothetical protein